MSDNDRAGRPAASGDPFLVSEGVDATAAGHDGVTGSAETDPDRRGLRAEIGKYVSLAQFPATTADLLRLARDHDAPAQVLQRLEGLDPQASFDDNRDLWQALGLGTGERF